ncbi:MAG TPA: YceI family protein [Burkholderiales bacterium]|nr:YceI family protein [Burkholderiales bacterium]
MKLVPVVMGFIFAALAGGHAAAADRYRIDPDHTFAHFAVVHTGVSSVRGRMGINKGSATLDADQQTAEFTVDLDPRSIDTGVKKLDAVLIDEMFFNVARYKTARFAGHAVQFRDGVPSEFDGDLMIHGVTRPVHLIADHFVCRQVKILVLDRFVCGGDLQATLKRSDFGLDKYLSMVSDEVRLVISVEAIREEK